MSLTLNLNSDGLYRALKTHDARFDGRFYVGVSSTRIYCRPVCTAKTPKRANCTFYPSAAAAEQAGFRPCLRCRPEQAPGMAPVDATRRLAHAAARLIEESGLADSSLEDCARRLGVTDRHLRRTFQTEFGVPPVAFLQTQRLLLAKGLLRDTGLPVTAVAMASGFGSLRRFNTLFKTRYRMSPTAVRKSGGSRVKGQAHRASDAFVFELSYRPPYAWEEILEFLGGRAIPGLEAVVDGAYRRSLSLSPKDTGWFEVRPAPGKPALRVTVSSSLARVLPRVLARVKTLFDLACDPAAVAEQLGPMAAAAPGLRVPGCVDGFEMAVRAVLGQQITVAAARTLASRVARALGTPLLDPPAGLDHCFPSPSAVLAATPARLGKLGIVRQRVGAIREIARLIESGELRLDPTAPVEATVDRLEAVGGIGEWTAQYIAMRALSWPDAFPKGDWGVKKALDETTPSRLEALAEAWRPWRSYAVIYLWHSLSKGKS